MDNSKTIKGQFPTLKLIENGNGRIDLQLRNNKFYIIDQKNNQVLLYFDRTELQWKVNRNGEADTIPLIGSRIINKNLQSVTVENTTTETEILTYTLPAHRLTNNGVLRCLLDISNFDILNNNQLSFHTYYGGSKIATATISNNAGKAMNGHTGRIIVSLASDGLNNQQGFISSATGAGAYEGPTIRGKSAFVIGAGTTSIDATKDQIFKITAEWNNASLDNSITKFISYSELIQ